MTANEFDIWLKDGDRRPLVMGVLNVTPDSFSDGGKFAAADAAIAQAEEMVAHGASILDIGGESTRPGSLPIEPSEQIRRILPVIEAISGKLSAVLSVDTTRSEVAKAALDAGCHVINDISAGRDDSAMLPLAAAAKVPIVLMHMQGTPATMQRAPTYADVIGEVRSFLAERIQAAQKAGVDVSRILIDPGIGFGKAMNHNLELLRRQHELADLGRPMVVGTSRKGFIGTITGEPTPADRLFGTAASVAWSIANAAAIVRVHDVKPMVQVVKTIEAIRKGWIG